MAAKLKRALLWSFLRKHLRCAMAVLLSACDRLDVLTNREFSDMCARHGRSASFDILGGGSCVIMATMSSSSLRELEAWRSSLQLMELTIDLD